MKKIAFIMSMVIAFCQLSAFATTWSYENAVFVTYNDTEIAPVDVIPYIENDRVMVPARYVLEKLDATVEWNELDKIVTVRKGDVVNIIKTDTKTATKAVGLHDVYEIELDAAPTIKYDRVFVPIRYFAEAIGVDVEWNGDTRTVELRDNAKMTFEEKLFNSIPNDKNFMVSPISIKMALAMSANGAYGDTKSEMLKTLGIADLDEYNEETKELIERFNELNTSKDSHTEFKISNSIWINSDTAGEKARFDDKFTSTVANNYFGTSSVVNKKNAVDKINAWVSDATNKKITEITQNSDFLAMLINAIYMKAKWIDSFDKSNTYKEAFTDIEGNAKDIDFMHQTERYGYYKDATTEAVQIPYYDGLCMYAIKGDADFNKLKDMDYRRVRLSMPKWTARSSFDLKDTLYNMGMKKAFMESADFSKMLTSDTGLLIDSVIHKTYINVDEEGTEAAAVTAVVVGATSALLEDPIEFKLNEPFTYYIYDRITDTILFMGKMIYAE